MESVTNGDPRRPVGYHCLHCLQELSSQRTAEVTTVLANGHSGFEELLQSPVGPDTVILILKILANACQYDEKQSKATVLRTACHSNFLEGLKQHLFSISIENNEGQKSGKEDFIDDLLIVYETVMKLLPDTAAGKFEDLFKVTNVMMTASETRQRRDFAIQKEKFSSLQIQLTNMIEERNCKGSKMKNKAEHQRLQCPSNNFRENSVFPSVVDIFGDAPKIHPNIVNGAYEDVEHYLDIQFRLLQEDFVSPLRESITQFVHQSDSMTPIDNVRIYRNVIFGYPKVVNDQIGIIVHFDLEKQSVNTKWEETKRFMFGSLLCFSKNNFQDILFGTVLERERNESEKGQITIALSSKTWGQEINLEGQFIMAESETYFEQYQLVLRALQIMTKETFPMYRYIVVAERERRPPQYLEENPNVSYQIDGKNIELLNQFSWPSEESLCLDSFQFDAFRAALTEEFVVIEGPPGTGKTFVGLKVARALLDNSSVWNTGKTPILVMCHTNHALDQFLEGLLSITEDIVRVGGQANNEKLQSYDLKEKRKCFQDMKASSALRHDVYDKLCILTTRIKAYQVHIEELGKKIGVLRLEELERAKVISDNHLRCFKRPQAFADAMCEWLWEGFHDVDLDLYLHSTEAADASDVAVSSDPAVKVEDGEDRIVLDSDHVFETCAVTSSLPYSVDTEQLAREVLFGESEIKRLLLKKEGTSLKEQKKLVELVGTCSWKRLGYKYWKTCLQRSNKTVPEHTRTLHATHNLWQLPHEDRWILYNQWIDDYKRFLGSEIREIECDYRRVFGRYVEAKKTLDLEGMQNSRVIGMTTAMAVQMQSLLQTLKPKIVIVEEADEVLESHLVVSLTKHCEHLILMGDIQQLHPSSSVYRLAVQFGFDMSLFERMVKSGIHLYRLGVQHRMHPNIARLIVPTIYPELLNHPSVQKYQQVKGVTKPLFFISHCAKEEEVKDIMSHQNIHEAEFILHLCCYLLLQGYQPSDITILSTCKGQMFYMIKRQGTMEALQDVKITVVGNFRGEENKIILLSLVRSNEEAEIGFLKMENFVCAALSRAREGLFIIGNMDNLAKSSTIWAKVKCSLEEQGSFGTALTLQCSVHPHKPMQVSSGVDFANSAHGGRCWLPCDALLKCGHRCQSVCHTNNRRHKDSPPECFLGHPCTKQCYLPCGKCATVVEKIFPCGHTKDLPCHVDHLNYECRVVVKVNLPHCGHIVDKLCFKDINTFPCPVQCKIRLPCGHNCVRSCHLLDDPDHLKYKCLKPCANKNIRCVEDHICDKLCYEECEACSFEVKKKLPCGHIRALKCSQEPSQIECQRLCGKILPCGHSCPQACNEKCGRCQEMVVKKIGECGHEMRVKCSDSKCTKPCERKLECGHDCMEQCGSPCSTKCCAIVTSPVLPACGHSAVESHCFMADIVKPTSLALLSSCRFPCVKVLACGHECSGSCGECFQGRIHAPCQQKCDRILVCGHKCKIPCLSACPPCMEMCVFTCQHSSCPNVCGEPCIPCKEPCGWHCEHSYCSKLCHEICDRDPCCEPCKKKLICGHDCIGFCGEPCPPLCRICDKDKVTGLFFGTEDQEDARFVLLVDCQHILESGGLENWLSQAEHKITLKTCPKCKSSILKTQRYMNFIKQAFDNVQAMKRKVFGWNGSLKNKIVELETQIGECWTEIEGFLPSSQYCREALNRYQSLKPVRRTLSLEFVECLRTQVHVLVDLKESLEKVDTWPIQWTDTGRAIEHVVFLLDILKSREHMSQQEVEDIRRECRRFSGMAEFLKSFNRSLNCGEKTDVFHKLHSILEREIYSFEIFSPEKDRKVKTIFHLLSKMNHRKPLAESEWEECKVLVNLESGHWLRCLNPHCRAYAIGESGGALGVSRCSECRQQMEEQVSRMPRANSPL